MFTDAHNNHNLSNKRDPSSRSHKKKLGETIDMRKHSSNNSTMTKVPINLPRFNNSIDSINLNFSNKMNRLVSIDSIRDRSPKKTNNMADRNKEILEKTNTISKIFNSDKHRANKSYVDVQSAKKDNRFENHKAR